ncbi:MAG: lamin tail domain-containing protein [Chloroflexi bacterium]|nr:lamin tail domain-containing protein [Chloroflexota bacterium]
MPAAQPVRIHEIFPAPAAGQREWIKVQAGEQRIQLTGWQIDDGTGGGAAHTIADSTTIEPFEIAMIELPQSLLNNDGDRVMLIDPAGTIIDLAEYRSTRPGSSVCLGDDGWTATCQTDQATATVSAAVAEPAAPDAAHSTTASALATEQPTPRRPRWQSMLPDSGLLYTLPVTPTHATATPAPTHATATPAPTHATATPAPTRVDASAGMGSMLGGGIICIGVFICGYGLMRR